MMSEHTDPLADLGQEEIFEKEMRGYSRRQVDEFVARARSQIRDLEQRLSRSVDDTERARLELSTARQDLSSKPAHEEVSERVGQILKLAADEAKAERERGSQLVKSSTLSQETFDQRVNSDEVAKAAAQSAHAALESAQINLDYAYVKAPISGRVSRAEITVGNLVGSPTAPPQLLTSIVSDNGVYADFEVDEQTYLNNVRNYGQLHEEQQKIPVDVVVRNNEDRVYRGHIYSFDNRIDNASGSIRARARFDNTDGGLIPGMFVSVRMGNGAIDDALLVPESAIGNDQSKRFVFVVGDGNKAEYRSVALGPQVDGNRVVLTGLKAGDRVILDHLQRLAPGAPVVPNAAHSRTASND